MSESQPVYNIFFPYLAPLCYNIITYKLDQFKEAGQQRDHEKTVVGGIMDTENEPKSRESRVDELSELRIVRRRNTSTAQFTEGVSKIERG